MLLLLRERAAEELHAFRGCDEQNRHGILPTAIHGICIWACVDYQLCLDCDAFPVVGAAGEHV